MDLKVKDHVVANEAMGKKFKMDAIQLLDSAKTKLRIKQTTGYPIILFKQGLIGSKGNISI